MKTATVRPSGTQITPSETAETVKREIAAMESAYNKASASRESALAFLQSAGIVTAKGNLTKKYR